MKLRLLSDTHSIHLYCQFYMQHHAGIAFLGLGDIAVLTQLKWEMNAVASQIQHAHLMIISHAKGNAILIKLPCE